ncbi:MAG: ABC transporter permease [Hyphomicrobiaceae bacterium]
MSRVFALPAQFRSHRTLIHQLIRREVVARYRGSALGILWSMITPLFMLATFTFVFGTIFQTRWTTSGATASIGEFAIIIFVGLIVFQLFSEVVNRAPTLVLSNPNYVKKVVFPLEILPVVALGSALFHTAVSLLVLCFFMLAFAGHVPLTLPFLPVVLAPLLLVILGLSWFLSSLGVYFRDISQVLGTLLTALMFLSPIFFPSSALPDWVKPWLILNPLSLPIEQARDVLIWGKAPDFLALAIYTLPALAVAAGGLWWFQKTRKGFADVL